MKFDSSSVVPLGWVISGMSVVVAGTITGVFWISTVNFRLERIEEKLGIPPYHAVSQTVRMDEINVNAKRLPKHVQLVYANDRPKQSD